ncbi:Cmx/CmrA family chloramphenicol efflux MFS transporter [Phytomonospora endophytica]|uniref:DHA1 family chloramphenicol resistance protein-like MFS transporter n=1 Tax=Phytomonospora endophytica TaxID=714109 RepID=A0A841FMY3_9ACTN|nr:Cmx/CmrA family chloramphenicol efflux MFS transporter [Phytomonospora endophytica]MBB6033969.1 DHA1 family chloramphenicol resistance protein-like MFS transporter [Phytomonospora endophytica]GIG64510.1 chloramphenicol resistance protein [Phytomonospora endophytica]
MPFAVYMLALAVFAQGTSEFMLAGLVPDIAGDLSVSIPAAGNLTSAFALGMIIGAPLMAILSLRRPRRRALLIFLITFLLVHIVGAVTTSYAVLLATRVIAALANAGFLAVALTTAGALVAGGAKGRVTSVLLGGVTVACVAGVPGGALLGQVWGWRAAFWAVAAVSVPAVVAILRSVPAGPPPSAGTSARRELRALRDTRLLTTLLLGALVNGGTFCAFTFLAPLLTEVGGIGEVWVPALLALFGLGSFAGVTAGGRFADARPRRMVLGGGGALAAGWALFALTAGNPVPAVVLVPVLAALSFAVGSTLIARALYAAPTAPTLAGGFATAAFNVGGALGPWAGGLAIGAGLGFRSPLWVSAGLVALALIAAIVSGFGRPVRESRPHSAATGL